MASGHREHELREMSVPDNQLSKPTAIDLSSLPGQREQRWIDQQLLVAIAFVCRGVIEARPRAHVDLLTVTACDITDGGRQREDIVMEAHATIISYRRASARPCSRSAGAAHRVCGCSLTKAQARVWVAVPRCCMGWLARTRTPSRPC